MFWAVCFFAAGEGRCKCSEVMSQFTELEELEAFVATQDLLAFECENIRKDFISEYLGDESVQRTRFEKSTVTILLNSMSLAPTEMATLSHLMAESVKMSKLRVGFNSGKFT